VENVLQESLEGPYTGTYDDQKIRHTALDTVRCPPDGPFGTYGVHRTFKHTPGAKWTFVAFGRLVKILTFAEEINTPTDAGQTL
jgi:hypothetical protein